MGKYNFKSKFIFIKKYKQKSNWEKINLKIEVILKNF